MRFFDRALANGRSIRVRSTDRSDGDFSITASPFELEDRRRRIVDRPWMWLQQVHGNRCVVVEADAGNDLAGRDRSATAGAQADAAVTTRADIALCVQTADCVPIALWSDDGVIAVIHAGWRGLEAGVIDSGVTALRSCTTAPLHALVGPSIGPECYEFGAVELDRLCERFGISVRSQTSAGRTALDVRIAVRSELTRLSVAVEMDDDRCTACDEGFFSHRARKDAQRQSTVIWIEES